MTATSISRVSGISLLNASVEGFNHLVGDVVSGNFVHKHSIIEDEVNVTIGVVFAQELLNRVRQLCVERLLLLYEVCAQFLTQVLEVLLFLNELLLFVLEATLLALGTFAAEESVRFEFALEVSHILLVTAGLVMVLIVFSVLTMTGVLSIGKYSIFDILDQLTSCVLMPLGALGMAIFLGWFVKKDVRRNALYPSHKNIEARLLRFTFTMLINRQ